MVKLIETLPLVAILTQAKQIFENPNSLIWPENSPRIRQFDQLESEQLLRLFEDKATNPFFNQQWIILFYKNSDPNSINFTKNYFNPQVAEVYQDSKLLDLKKSNKVKFGAVDCEATAPANDEMEKMCEKYLSTTRSLIDAAESGQDKILDNVELPQIRIISHRKIGKNKSKNVSLDENFIYLFFNGLQKSLETQQTEIDATLDLDQIDGEFETLYLEDILSADSETVDIIDIAGIPRPRQKSDCADGASKTYFTELDSKIARAKQLMRSPENRNLIRQREKLASQMIADLEARFFEEDS